MYPVKSDRSTRVFKLPPEGDPKNDLWVEDAEDVHGNKALISLWSLTEKERLIIAAGGNIELIVWGTRHQPVALNATNQQRESEPTPRDGESLRLQEGPAV